MAVQRLLFSARRAGGGDCHPTLTDAEIDKTCAVIRQVMGSASA